MISFQNLVVRYPGSASTAVAGVTFTAEPGRITAVAGPNGSGKSTLVRTLVGRLRPTAGHIVLGGVPRDQLGPREVARRVAVVTQREELAFTMPARAYVALGRFPHLGDWNMAGAADREAVQRSLELAGVAALAERPVDQLSGGEWQRVRVARALAQGAPALVLDEPTTFLDIAHEMAIFELLHQLAADGRTILVVSHQLNLLARFASHIVVLHAGTIAAAGSPDDVMRAAILECIYGWPIMVTRDAAVGAPTLVPLRGGPMPGSAVSTPPRSSNPTPEG